MSIKNETIHENILEDGLNANADTINDDNDDDGSVSDQKNDKLDYFDIDSDGNLNIRCVGTDFQVNNFPYMHIICIKPLSIHIFFPICHLLTHISHKR